MSQKQSHINFTASNVCRHLRADYSSSGVHRELFAAASQHCHPRSTVPLVTAPAPGHEGASPGGSTRLHSPGNINVRDGSAQHLCLEASVKALLSIHISSSPLQQVSSAINSLQIYIRAGEVRI